MVEEEVVEDHEMVEEDVVEDVEKKEVLKDWWRRWRGRRKLWRLGRRWKKL